MVAMAAAAWSARVALTQRVVWQPFGSRFGLHCAQTLGQHMGNVAIGTPMDHDLGEPRRQAKSSLLVQCIGVLGFSARCLE